MAKMECKAVITVLLLVAVVSVLQGASGASSGSFRKSLLSRLGENGESRRVTMATTRSFRAELTRQEPKNLGATDRIRQSVDSSIARAAILKGRMQGSTDWNSNVSAVPGGYAMSLSLGTPAQTFSVIADTGSDLTWVQGKGCSKCFKQPDQPYDRTKSSSYAPLSCSSKMCTNLGQQATCKGSGSCTYTYEYGDQSTTNGAFSTETITLASADGEDHVPNFAFGDGTDNSVDFDGVDGLLGLGQGPISFPSQLGSQYGNVFSYCLVNWSDSPNQTSPIIFGSDAVPSGNIQYTPLQTIENLLIPTFWFLSLTSVSVDGQKIIVEKATGPTPQLDLGTVIDSGTTISMLDPSAYTALSKSVKAAVKYPKVSGGNSGLDVCFDTSKDANPTFPGTTFHFDGGDWVLPQENTFLPVDDKGTWCLAMIASTQEIQIFGNTQQQNFQIVYDQPNTQLGWVKTQCDSL